jgi:beta-glucosidase
MAVAAISGIQEQRVIAVAKHFAGNNSEFARMTLSSDIDERTLREIYLPAFEAPVKEGKPETGRDSSGETHSSA